ncbi:predicted protein [Histoplasma mississippiense (nom. inval.)]|uniref:predicted protein n=1 Tax=Ajellomyces capsulatus (strain NAm1 / WU24) TaxID=2059318 RepID=UPI000157B850|nr:predicted protein [Histoplasma mississippiense (nom. inval.)]EDN03726.1 predicted protein [Histoplasma mississippiense (nom. inval.)]
MSCLKIHLKNLRAELKSKAGQDDGELHRGPGWVDAHPLVGLGWKVTKTAWSIEEHLLAGNVFRSGCKSASVAGRSQGWEGPRFGPDSEIDIRWIQGGMVPLGYKTIKPHQDPRNKLLKWVWFVGLIHRRKHSFFVDLGICNRQSYSVRRLSSETCFRRAFGFLNLPVGLEYLHKSEDHLKLPRESNQQLTGAISFRPKSDGLSWITA